MWGSDRKNSDAKLEQKSNTPMQFEWAEPDLNNRLKSGAGSLTSSPLLESGPAGDN